MIITWFSLTTGLFLCVCSEWQDPGILGHGNDIFLQSCYWNGRSELLCYSYLLSHYLNPLTWTRTKPTLDMLYLRIALGLLHNLSLNLHSLTIRRIVLIRASLLNILSALLFKYRVLFADFACIMLRGGFSTLQGAWAQPHVAIYLQPLLNSFNWTTSHHVSPSIVIRLTRRWRLRKKR